LVPFRVPVKVTVRVSVRARARAVAYRQPSVVDGRRSLDDAERRSLVGRCHMRLVSIPAGSWVSG